MRSFLTLLMLVLLADFFCTPDASFGEEFLTLLMLVLLGNVSCTPRDSFSEECLLHS